jgi:phenylpropionate dioxygenase-like ring-hydroxylating dioxygenase large terminal subunit
VEFQKTTKARAGEVEATLKALGDSVERGLLPSGIFSDPKIFDLEIERIFSRVWLYVGHESEVPHPGDYVVRNLSGDSFILVRGKDGKMRLLLNKCRHRGNMVCGTERGNASTFRCPYHGWVYDNTGDLVGVPVLEAYGDNLNRDEWGLVPVPRLDQYNGLIFATVDSRAPSLDDYLGEMKWYLDIVTKRSDAGLEVVGGPHRWIMNANWKYPAENFAADALHAGFVHHSLMEIGLIPGGAGSAGAWAISLPNGHCPWCNLAHPDVPVLSVRSYPTLMESVKRNLLPEQWQMFEKAPYWGGNVFPNLSYMDMAFPSVLEEPSVSYISFRVWQPIAVDQTEACSWFLVEKDAPLEFKEASYNAYTRQFGPGGIFEQDDIEVWCRATWTSKGPMGRNLVQNVSLGISCCERDPTFPGPGEVVAATSCDVSLRAFYRRWLQYLSGEV